MGNSYPAGAHLRGELFRDFVAKTYKDRHVIYVLRHLTEPTELHLKQAGQCQKRNLAARMSLRGYLFQFLDHSWAERTAT